MARGVLERWSMLTPTPDLVPTETLLELVLTKYHQPLPAQLRLAEELATKVARVHGGGDGRLHELDAAVQALVDALMVHLSEEERDLFPLLRAGVPAAQLDAPLQSMRGEHQIIAGLFERMRALTEGFTLPPQACSSWRRLYAQLELLEREIAVHVGLEDELVARCVEGAAR